MNARVILLVIGYDSDPIKQIADSLARENNAIYEDHAFALQSTNLILFTYTITVLSSVGIYWDSALNDYAARLFY